MSRVTTILLAAGMSRRMGQTNKLLLPVHGVPMIRHVAETYLGVGSVTVVTGHDAPAVAGALEALPVSLAHNPDHTLGQPGSVAVGLAAAPDAELLLIGLGDQPLLRTQDLSDLISAHHAGDAGKITIPIKGGTRGNPIVVPRAIRPLLTEDPRRPGCMRFTRTHPEHVRMIPMPARGFYLDVDTPAQFSDLVAQPGP